MVSFQCNGCGDVVKKPKLDTHHARCHAPVDCIDCSTTFRTPAEFKGHTSCITEAEKYQKGLYKGPKAKQDKKQNRVKGNANGNIEQVEADAQAGDQPKEQPQKGDGTTDATLTPVVPEPSKPLNASGETTATTASTGKAKDKKRKEKKSKLKNISDNQHSPKIEPSATTADPIPVPTPASPEKVIEPTGQKLDKDNESEKVEESEDTVMKDANPKTQHKAEDEGGEKTEGKKSKKKKKHKQKMPDSSVTIVEGDGKGAKEGTAMDVDEPKAAMPQNKNEELKDKHSKKKKRKDASTATTMEKAEADSGKEQPKSPKEEKKSQKTSAPSDVKAAMAGDEQGTDKVEDNSKKRKRGIVEAGGGAANVKKKKGNRVPGGDEVSRRKGRRKKEEGIAK